MKKYIISIMLCLPLTVMAQNVWERPESETTKPAAAAKVKKVKSVEDPKYLEGAVPEVDGKVEWTLNVDVPGKKAQELYDAMLKYMDELTHDENQLEGSGVAIVNKQDHVIVTNVREWLVFKDQFISLDRTKFHYSLVTTCTDGHVKVLMGRMIYRYEEERGNGGQVMKAEELINDKNALTKKNDKLYKTTAKFRRKTIDRKDFLFGDISNMLKRL
ncbi:MAG: DUF4468 domain-containing protein [Prevotella sp.]|nr:DUF4468 domain-containing protein [Prevotella sp.]